MKSSADKDRKRNPVKVQTPEHDLPGRIMAPPPFALDASTDVPRKKREDEEEALQEEQEKGS